jgi:hypothetical protein
LSFESFYVLKKREERTMCGDEAYVYSIDTTPPFIQPDEDAASSSDLLEQQLADITEKLNQTEERLQHETVARQTAENDLHKCDFFLKRSQEIGLIGSFVLDIPSDRPETQSWHSTPMMDQIFGIDVTYPRTGESWLRLIVQQEEVAE